MQEKISKLTSEQHKDRVKHNLSVPFGVNGERLNDRLKVINDLQRAIKKKCPEATVVLFGSLIGGYSNSESDIDFYILVKNNEQRGDVEEIYRDFFESQEYKDFQSNQTDIKLECHQILIINPGRIINEIDESKINNRSKNYYNTVLSLKLLSYPWLSLGAQEWRNEIKEKAIDDLTEEKKAQFVDLILANIVYGEEKRIGNRQERLSHITKEEHEMILLERQKMWRARIEKIWGIKPSELDRSQLIEAGTFSKSMIKFWNMPEKPKN